MSARGDLRLNKRMSGMAVAYCIARKLKLLRVVVWWLSLPSLINTSVLSARLLCLER
mgnify:CR=1 FL=1